MAKGLWLLLASTVVFVTSQQDKYTDENRPYKFGFNIEGYQHRKEEKDEKGIIKGEYGFITADGYYRITVYATDENGAFRIISMKNIYVGFPPEDPTTTPAPERQQGQRLNLKFKEINSGPSGTTLRAPISPAVYSTTPAPVPSTTQFGNGKAACSSCFLPPPTTQRTQLSPIGQAQPGGIRSPGGLINRGGQQLTSELNGKQPGGSPITNKVNTQQDKTVFGGGNKGNSRGPSGSIPVGQSPTLNKAGQPFISPGDRFQPPGPNRSGQSFVSPDGRVQPARPVSSNGREPEQFNPVDINNRFSPARIGTDVRNDDLLGSVKEPLVPNNQRGYKNTQNNQQGNARTRKPGEEKEGLPPGISEDDIKDLLYTFNYTVGFHGHHEDGYVSGNKKGDYFFDGRDGTERRVEYIANEFGYQPNITLIPLADNDIRKPKEETEKDFGLKGYEFKWFRTP